MIVDRNKITYLVTGTTPPHSTEVLWLDTSYSGQPVLKWYNNGEWVPVTTDMLVEDDIIGMYVIQDTDDVKELIKDNIIAIDSTWSSQKIHQENNSIENKISLSSNYNHTLLYLVGFNVEEDEDLVECGLLTEEELEFFKEIYPDMGGIDFLGMKGSEDKGSISIYVEDEDLPGTLFWFGQEIDDRIACTQWLDIIGGQKYKREFDYLNIEWGEWEEIS